MVSVTPARILDPHAPTVMGPALCLHNVHRTCDTFYLYTKCSFFQKEIYVQVYPNTVAHRLFHILNITTPLVLSHGRYSRRTIRKNCLDARTFATKRDIKKSQLTHGVKIFIEKMHIIL